MGYSLWSSKRDWVGWCGVALLCAAPWLSGCSSHVASASPAPAAQARHTAAEPAPPARPTPSADEGEPARFTTTGPLVAVQQSDVAAERDGRIVNIAVEIGDHVRQGQVLASLDDRNSRTQVAAAEAHLASMRAQVLEWQSEQQMDGADLRRADQMRADKIMSEENWEHVKYKLDEVIAEVARYKAEVQQAEADLKSAQIQLEQCQVVAPFAGVVGRRSLRLDQQVAKGDVLFWITAEAPLRVLFTVPESSMAPFRVGAPLVLTTADYPQLRQNARVERVSPVVDPASDSVQVIGELVHPSRLLKPGMSMQIALNTPAHTRE